MVRRYWNKSKTFPAFEPEDGKNINKPKPKCEREEGLID